MKLAVLSESSADEAALRILVDGILNAKTEPVALDKFAARPGWQARLNILPAVLKELHYHTDAEGLVLVLDSDKSPVHVPTHDQPGGMDAKCRLCRATEQVRLIQQQLRPLPGRSSLNVAVGLAVPCFEAWLRCGIDSHVTEAAWSVALQSGQFPYDNKRLKIAVYQTDRPSIQVETLHMTAEAQRLVGILPEVERWFPNGFGSMSKQIRSW